MEFTQYTLPNGIRCIHKQVRSAVVHCALSVNTGSRDELTHEEGLAHLLEHAFFKGTQRRKAFHINCRLENLGGELNAYTTKEETVIHATTLRSDFAKAAELISDLILHSTFPQKEIEREKLIIIDEINSYKDSPSEYIFDHFEDLVFTGSSLGHNILGCKNSVMKLTQQNLVDFTARTYNTDQMVFSSIGNISPKRFIELCDRYFGEAISNPRNFARQEPSSYTPFATQLHKNNHQAHCILGNRSYGMNQPERVTLSLITNLLGGPSANSLLNVAVRERNGLSYNIEAGHTPFSDTGIASIYFGTDKEKVDLCLELIDKEIRKLCNGELSSRALSMAKRQFIGQLTVAMEGNEGYMLGAARSYMIYNAVDNMDLIRHKINEITPTSIAEVTQAIFGSNISTLIYK